MRQYREYLDQQREMQRAQDLILEEQYRERRAAEQIKQFNELEALRKQQAKQAKKEQKERDAIQKQHEKQEQNDTRLFDKYNIKIKDYLQKHKIVRLDLMAKQFWLQRQQVDTVVQKLFKNDPDFNLCLWSDDGTTVMYVQPDDYRRIGSLLDSQGKLNAQACVAASTQKSE
ncbi:hypothetical protein BC940DRAFT_293233 [Gongronella butleri]|nr:hypothetical protein BC940DRAFT_293233 [Gongronella butleri]